jgi:hypothetical protein
MGISPKLTIQERLEARIDRSGGPDACHPWNPPYQSKGYGAIQWQGKKWLVHRLVWTLANGEIPKDIEIRHSCDNPPCCNLRHLLTGTHTQNMDDMRRRKRSGWLKRETCKNNHPRTPENIQVRPDGFRDCVPCMRERSRANWEAQKAKRTTCPQCGLVTTRNYMPKHNRRRHAA